MESRGRGCEGEGGLEEEPGRRAGRAGRAGGGQSSLGQALQGRESPQQEAEGRRGEDRAMRVSSQL